MYVSAKFLNDLSREADVYSSLEPRAQVSFSVRKNINDIKKSSSPEPLGQFKPYLEQNILGWREFKFVQMKGQTLSKGR